MDTELQDQISDIQPQLLGPAKARIRPIFLILQGLIAIGIVFGASLVMQMLVADKTPPSQRPVREQVFTVDTIAVDRGDHQPRISVFGSVVAGNIIELRTELSGPLTSVNPAIRSGAVVRAGTELATIDPFEYQTALAEAETDILDAKAKLLEAEARIASETTDLENTKAQLELAIRDLQRAEALVARGSVTQQTVDQRQQALLQRKAELDTTQSTLRVEQAKLTQQQVLLDRLELQRRRATRNLSLTKLSAPVDAVVETESIAEGQMVTASQAIAQLLDLSSFEVHFTLSDDQYGRLTDESNSLVGTEIEVLWKIGGRQDRVSATIKRIAPTIATDRGGVTIHAVLQGLSIDSDLRPGAFVEVDLPDRVYENAIRVPESSVYDEERIYILEEGRLRAVPVSVLAFFGTDVIVSGDLPANAKVLKTRIAEVGEGLRVQDSADPAPPSRGNGKRGKPQDTAKQVEKSGVSNTDENGRNSKRDDNQGERRPRS